MSPRSTPQRLEAAKRAATIERLVSAGMLRERAKAALAAWEVGQDGRRDWDAAHRAIAKREGPPSPPI